jgi:dTDP-4-dehydrorhamnose reductase
VRVLLTGAGGQLGGELVATAPPGVDLRALRHAQLDIAEPTAVGRLLEDFRPEVVINAAAYTRVDDAEAQTGAARSANCIGPEVLATACLRQGAWLIHVSTDYVFDGNQVRSYAPSAIPRPVNTYGATKLEGEIAIVRVLRHQSTIVRASWLYSGTGRNFVTRMLALMSEQRTLRVVCDQVGVPTCCAGLARVLWAFVKLRAPGIHHWCDSGVASWYDFAIAIAEEGSALGLVRSPPEIVPVTTAEYPSAARRPAFSMLDKRETERLLDLRATHWRTALRNTLRDLTRDAPPGRSA